jgi:peptidoglycan L-alanyl-D-glutamate endopeptidase CwlK
MDIPARTKRTIENLGSLNRRALAKLEPFVQAAEAAMAARGMRIEVISGLRSWAAQAALYAQGRTKQGRIVTKARPGSSWHNYGLAIDLGLFNSAGVYVDARHPALAEKLYRELGALAVKHGVEWAGTWKSFPEGPHFQVTFGLTLGQARQRLVAANYDVQKVA